MVKKQVFGAESKVLKSKPKKPAAQAVRQKSQPQKPSVHGAKKAPVLGTKGRLVKPNPGLSLSTDSESQEKDKDAPRCLNPDQPTKTRMSAHVNDDDVVSQMQLYEKALKERQKDIKIPTAGMDERLSLSSPPPPNLIGTLDEPEVSTPFNKRLVSSTPDPERLLDFNNAISTLSQPQSYEFPLSSAPQMVPERDTAADEKSKLTLSGIEELLQQQKQNQLIWQQQLAQFQTSLSPSKKPERKPEDQSQSTSAFYKWLGIDASIKSNLESVPVSESNVSGASLDHLYPKAEWVEEGGGIFTPTQGSSTDRSSEIHSDQDAQKKEDPPAQYATFGASSSKQDKWEDILKQRLDCLGPASVRNQNQHGMSKAGNKISAMPPKSVKESSIYDRFASSKPLSIAKPNPSLNALPHAEAEKIRSKPVSVHSKSGTVHKAVVPKLSARISSKTFKDSKGKNKKEVDPSVDERGVDIPPSETVVETASPVTAEFGYVDKKTTDDVNVSMSTCSEEVNTLLSSEASDQSSAQYVEPVPKVTPREMPMEMTTETADQNGNQNALSSTDKLAILDVLSDVASSPELISPVRLDTNSSSKTPETLGEDTKEVKDNEDYSSCKIISANTEQRVISIPPVSCADGSQGSIEDDENPEPQTGIQVNKEEKDENLNQNYHDEEERYHSRHQFNLHYLDKMADPTLHDIACRLALKATTIRDRELRNLIDSMIYHTDAALAHEDTRFQSSQMFFVDENNKLKKRIHTINKQLEAKERLERQADVGISNTDVMHLERKNLYLRQEKDRLDQQVTNLLEEKAKWLNTQQDLVKTISLKDHEILKLEEKHQGEKKSLHQTLDQTTKNSQGVHYKLSVADREISNLEQRMKSKEREIFELKERLTLIERELNDCMECSRTKDAEMVRLRDLVDTLKVGVDEVLKAYEASSQGREETEDQRQGISFLRQMVADQTRHTYPEGLPTQSTTRPRPARKDSDPSSLPHSPRHEMQRRQEQKHRSHHRSHSVRDRHLPSMWTDETIDSYLLQPAKTQDGRGSGPANSSTDGSSLTLKAVEEHNRRYSPVDRTLWRSLESQHVMPVFDGEEPYYSDSEIHVMNSRGRRRRRHHAETEFHDPDEIYQRYRQGSSLSPHRQKWNRESRRRDFLYHTGKSQRSKREQEERWKNGMKERSRRGNGTELRSPRKRADEVFTSTERYNYSDHDSDSGRGRASHEDSDLISLPLQDENSFDNREKSTRHSEANFFQHYSGRGRSDKLHDSPVRSRLYFENVEDTHLKGQDQDEPIFLNKSSTHRRSERSDKRHHLSTSEMLVSSLQSLSIPDGVPLEDESLQRLPARLAESALNPSTRVFTLSSDGTHFQTLHLDTDNTPLSMSDPLSSSYPGYKNSKSGRPMQSSNEQASTIMSASLPLSPRHRRDENLDQRHQHDNFHRSARAVSKEEFTDHPLHSIHQGDMLRDGEDHQFRDSGRGRQRMLYHSLNPSHLSQFPSGKRGVTFHEQSTDSVTNPSQSYQSNFLNYRTSFPPQSSPVNTSDISLSRRATRDTNSIQRDFFQGTELSASLSSISDQDVRRDAFDNSNNNQALDEESFATGIASLDSKIARLQEKINRTKAVFS